MDVLVLVFVFVGVLLGVPVGIRVGVATGVLVGAAQFPAMVLDHWRLTSHEDEMFTSPLVVPPLGKELVVQFARYTPGATRVNVIFSGGTPQLPAQYTSPVIEVTGSPPVMVTLTCTWPPPSLVATMSADTQGVSVAVGLLVEAIVVVGELVGAGMGVSVSVGVTRGARGMLPRFGGTAASAVRLIRLLTRAVNNRPVSAINIQTNLTRSLFVLNICSLSPIDSLLLLGVRG